MRWVILLLLVVIGIPLAFAYSFLAVAWLQGDHGFAMPTFEDGVPPGMPEITPHMGRWAMTKETLRCIGEDHLLPFAAVPANFFLVFGVPLLVLLGITILIGISFWNVIKTLIFLFLLAALVEWVVQFVA